MKAWIVAAGVTLAGAALMATVLGLLVWQWWRTPLQLPASGLMITVEQGEYLSALSKRLAEAEILEKPRWFRLAARIQDADRRIIPGEYQLQQGLLPGDLLSLLQSGDTVRYYVTIPEGVNLRETLQLLSTTKGLRSILDGERDPRLLSLAEPHLSAEGLFLPETYQYQRGDSDLDVLSQARRLMDEALRDAWAKRAVDLPFETPYEMLIMASIIEKETGLAEERAQISGVFVRRLEQGMRLQTDPSVIYGLGSRFDGNLTRRHLRDESNSYNSYRHAGLPPGPICLPGRAALLAAADPADGSALYFVARGDGGHVFSDTLEAHEAAVKQYQLTRRAGYRSSPMPKGTQLSKEPSAKITTEKEAP